MTDQTSAFSLENLLENLLRPFDPPPPNLPVCRESHERLLGCIQTLENNLYILRESIEMLPRHDVYIALLRENVANALEAAGIAYGVFMVTRDCVGEA